MTSVAKKVKRVDKIDPSKYINLNTGEELQSELNGASLLSTKDTNSYVIKSDDYTIIDSSAINFLKMYLNRSELGSIGIMSADLQTPLNLVFNNNVPHTNETLQKVLGIASNSTFTLLIKKLMRLGVLYQIKGNIMGSVRVIYMMNPFLARKRKQIDEKVVNIFIEFKMSINE
ncbi:MAG: hypothetical protein WC479_07820 [Candidatus Izemoplasmatales bacterium]|jgi:predicted transcriptional regulator